MTDIDFGRLARYVRAGGAVILVVTLGFVVLFTMPGVFGAEGSYVVLSDSMSPHIQAGDVVVIGPASADTIDRGDVITYRDTAGAVATGDTERVTHRVVEVVETEDGVRYRTQGDANDDPDPALVSPSQVVGEEWFHVPWVGYLVTFASSRNGILLFVVAPSLLLVASELYSVYDDALVEAEPDAPDEAAGAEASAFEWVDLDETEASGEP